MERASSEVLSVAQEAARLRMDTLSSSEDAQDCVGTERGLRRTPGCGKAAAPAPARPLLRRKLTLQPSAAETKASPRAKG